MLIQDMMHKENQGLKVRLKAQGHDVSLEGQMQGEGSW